MYFDNSYVKRPEFRSSISEYHNDFPFLMLHGFSLLCLMWTERVPTLMPGQQTFKYVSQLPINIYFITFCKWFLLPLTSFTIFCAIMLSPQYNWAYKTDVICKTKDTQWYFLVQLQSIYWNLTFVPINITAIHTRIALTSSVFSLERLHWDITSYALPGANKNSEKTLKHKFWGASSPLCVE